VGLPTPGTQVVVVDPRTHTRLPDGQQGLLLAAGPGVMSGYWADERATRNAFIDGWFDTGAVVRK
jgi:long-subunit acyl-CoA synthetase (AMP-forming)